MKHLKCHIQWLFSREVSFRIFCTLLYILFNSSSGFSQIQLRGQLEKDAFVHFSSEASLFVDSSANLTLQEIPQQKFQRLTNFSIPKSLIKGYKYNYWLRFEVENLSNDSLDLLLTTGFHQATLLYAIQQNKLIKVGEAQEKLSKKQRPFRSDDQYIPVRFLPKSKNQFYAKINDYPREDFSIQVVLCTRATANLHKLNAFYNEYVYLIAYGFLISVLFFVALFVFMFYLLDRQVYYLYYAAYTISIGLFNLWEYEHSPYIHLIFNQLQFLKFTGNSNIYVLLTHIFYFLFIFEFLELKNHFPLLAKIFRWVIISLSIFLLGDIFVLFVLKRLDWSTEMYWFFQDVFPVLNIVLLFMIFRAKGRVARNIQIGSTFLMIGGLAGFLTHYFDKSQLVLLRIDPSLLFAAGTLLEIFFFSVAIGIRSYNVQKEQKSLQKSIMESELRTLRSQINPHFVFNSLNSIKSYILTHRPTEASEYLTDFSTLMRATLQYSKEQLITLKDELEIMLLYISLEKRRFEENFLFNFELDPKIKTDEIMIPPMLLQPYIENAIKHGLMNKDGFRILTLKVQSENSIFIKIEIEDNGIGREKASLLKKNTPKHQSMGMSINEERIDLLSKTNDYMIDVQIKDKISKKKTAEGTKVVIRIPIA